MQTSFTSNSSDRLIRAITCTTLLTHSNFFCSAWGGGPFFFVGMLKTFFLLHCVPLYVCRLCINYQDLRTNLLGMAALRILLLTFISHFVIDFLSIRKVIIFSAIATDDRHPLRSRSVPLTLANGCNPTTSFA